MRLNQAALLVNCVLEGEEGGNDPRAHTMVFEENFKLQAALMHQRAAPGGANRHN